VFTCQFIRSLFQQKSNLRSLQRGGYKASPSLQLRVELELRVQVLQREGVWPFDRTKDHDTVSIGRLREGEKKITGSECERSAERSIYRSMRNAACDAFKVPSEDRCPRSSASRDGFSTLRANTQHRTNSSIRCNVSHAQHAFPMRHKSKSICTNNIAAKERTGDSYIAPLQFDLIATALSLGRSIVWRSFRNTGFPG